MRERGLRADFAAEAMRQAEAAGQASHEQHGDIRDLRTALWFSIDNDDTRDLDQLSVAEALPGGAARLLVAVADVDALVEPAARSTSTPAANTTSVYTAAGVFPMLPRVAVHRPDLAARRPGAAGRGGRHAGRSRRHGHRMRSIYRAAVLNRAKLTYDARLGLARRHGRRPRRNRQRAGPRGAAAPARPLASQLRQWRQQRGALNVKTISARPVFDGRPAGRPAPRREEPRQGPDRRPDDRDQRRDGALSGRTRLPVAAPLAAGAAPLGPHRRAGRGARRGAAGRARRAGAGPLPACAARRPTRPASPTCRWRS